MIKNTIPVGACRRLICVIMILGMVAPSIALAGQKEEYDKLVMQWIDRYGGTSFWGVDEPASASEIQAAKQAGLSYDAQILDSHIQQVAALKIATIAAGEKLKLSGSLMAAYYPSFRFRADASDSPYWVVSFNVNSKEHPKLKKITVHVNAISGSVRYIAEAGNSEG